MVLSESFWLVWVLLLNVFALVGLPSDGIKAEVKESDWSKPKKQALLDYDDYLVATGKGFFGLGKNNKNKNNNKMMNKLGVKK